VPGERIDGEALMMYLTEFIDPTARIRPCAHPTDKTRTGYNVTAKKVLNVPHLRDIISDSTDWDTESRTSSFKREPYRYKDSATWKRRRRVSTNPNVARKS
jgi:hypothetical protein